MQYKVKFLRQKWIKDEKTVDAAGFEDAVKAVSFPEGSIRVLAIEAERDSGQLEFPFAMNPSVSFASHLGSLLTD